MKAKWLLAVIIAMAIGVSSGANAAHAASLKAASAPSTSLPYVEDVSHAGRGLYAATIAVCGSEKALRKTSVKVVERRGGKKVRVDRLGRHVWACFVKAGREYKVTVKVKGGKSKSIGFRVW